MLARNPTIMKLAIFGARGNMGRRYAAICDYLHIDHIDHDIDFRYDRPIDCQKAIIATPVDTHIQVAHYCIANGMDFLCEKPIAKSSVEVEQLQITASTRNVRGYMVNNWRYVLRYPCKSMGEMNNYYTGADGLWDLIQPHYYLREFKVAPHPVFRLIEHDGTDNLMVLHTREKFDRSYVKMVADFALFDDPTDLMTLAESVEAHRKIERLIESGQHVS